MVGFNLLNQCARSRVFKKTLEKNIGVLGMFAVRRALSQPTQLKALIADLKQRGQIDLGAYDADDLLSFLTQEGKATTIPEAAYRFCRHEPGMHAVLTGTGNVEHLKANVTSLLKPPLEQADLQRLDAIFSRVDSVSGN
jgi:aryl-alcohol dehydrogenase-like predicted oxidoreductase